MTKNDLVIPDDEPGIVSQTLTPLLNWIRSERLHHRPDVINRCEHDRCRGERYPCDVSDWLDTAIWLADALTAAQGEAERLAMRVTELERELEDPWHKLVDAATRAES